MYLWQQIYEDKPPWETDCNGNTLNLGASIASEFARLITIEMKSEITGSLRAEFLNTQYKWLLNSLREKIERGCAIGGIMFKPYVQHGTILPDCVTQDCFQPISFNNSRIDGAIFYDRYTQGNKIYTRLEKQQYQNGAHTIESKAFISTNANTLGTQINLTDTPRWANINPFIEIKNVDRPLFSFWKVPLANQVDKTSPLGVSVYSRAIKDLKQADFQWARFLWEFEGSELAIDASEDLLRMRMDDQGKPLYKLPRNSERLFRKINARGSDPFYKMFNPDIRDESLLNGLDAIKREVEFKCSLAYGTLSNPQSVDKTAEEIKASKQRSYTTVCDMQAALQTTLSDYIYALDKLTDVCKLAPAGKYDTKFEWGDGVLEDTQVEQTIRLQEVHSGITRPEQYLMWRYGVTEKQAQQMLPLNNTYEDYFNKGEI